MEREGKSIVSERWLSETRCVWFVWGSEFLQFPGSFRIESHWLRFL